MSKMILLSFLLTNLAYANFNFSKDLTFKPIQIDDIEKKIDLYFHEHEQFPNSINVNNFDLAIDYTENEKLTKYVKKILRRYRSDYASVVVIDNKTSKIITAVDYTRSTKKFGLGLSLASTHPAASVYKIVTAASLFETDRVDEKTKFSYNGKSTTLYKYQLKNRRNRWTRSIDFKRAFALSNNVIFGKAAHKYLDHNELREMSERFGFYQNDLVPLLPMGTSKILEGESDFELAELASGFNKRTLITPYHGAVMASIIANDGVLQTPNYIERIYHKEFEHEVWKAPSIFSRVMSKESAESLQHLMEFTVDRGTARSAFRRWRHKDVLIGGKTGSLTGGEPYGKRDWFVSYSRGKDGEKGISVSIMITNVKKWYIKSTYFAKMIYDYYYREIDEGK